MKAILFTLISSLLLLVGCEQGHRHHTHKRTTAQTVHIREYRHQQDDNTWLYVYIMTNSNNNYYYYTSPSRVTSYSSIPFTSSGRSLPQDVKEEIENAEPIGEDHAVEAEMSDPTDTSVDESGTTEASDSVDSGSSGDSGGSSGDSGGGGSD